MYTKRTQKQIRKEGKRKMARKIDELRIKAKKITKAMEKEQFTYEEAEWFVSVLKDEIEECRKEDEKRLLTARK